MQNLSPQEAGRWMEAAPPAVQSVVMSPTTAVIISQIGQQYQLHIDVVNALLKLTTYMLVGYIDPQQFIQELTVAGVPQATATRITSDVNQKIFVPLQAKIRAEDQQQTSPLSVPQPAQPEVLRPQQQVPPRPQPQQFSQPRPQQPPPQPRPTYTLPANLPGAPSLANAPQNKSRFDRMLEDKEELHIAIGQHPMPQPITPPPRPAMPAPPPAPAPAPVRPMPPPPPIAKPAGENVVIKEYGTDPYREPFQI